ncbi:uncharacterized protein LOC135388798 [Ornithodoros turicata]|uniref:uncharacterized protein LOC135388798 n=1 Tax=Ornithodoros turicata TaxID=34597 RepID=UPI003139ABEF
MNQPGNLITWPMKKKNVQFRLPPGGRVLRPVRDDVIWSDNRCCSPDSTMSDSKDSNAASDASTVRDASDSQTSRTERSSSTKSDDVGWWSRGDFGSARHSPFLERPLSQLQAVNRQLELKIMRCENQLRSFRQACTAAECTLRDERALHASTRQELSRVKDRLKYYTAARGSRRMRNSSKPASKAERAKTIRDVGVQANTVDATVGIISRPLHSLINEKETAMAVLTREVKLLQEDRLSDMQHAMQAQQDLQEQLDRLRLEKDQLLDSYNTERTLRKKYFQMVQEMKGQIRVYCRVKPLTENDINKQVSSAVVQTDDYTLLVQTPRGDKEFTFDRVFMPSHTQNDVFRETHSLVECAIDGYNVCIFAYGQTGSGKTYTLLGEDGIVRRAFHRIFQLVEENKTKQEIKVAATFLELYNDRLIDLLNPKGCLEEKLEIRRDASGQTLVPGATVEAVESADHLENCLCRAERNRHVAATQMNGHSSRSHFVTTILLTCTNHFSGSVLRGKLSLVDLAGSERGSKSGRDHVKEANSINKSLTALGDVIQALCCRQPHVPYRNHKLTMLMQDSLGGTAKTLMFVNVSSAADNVDETINSLLYATRVRQITNQVTRAAETKEIAKLKSVIAKLKQEIGTS